MNSSSISELSKIQDDTIQAQQESEKFCWSTVPRSVYQKDLILFATESLCEQLNIVPPWPQAAG